MKKLLLLPFFCLLFAAAGAQRVYFIYLQTDGGQPFFVRMGDKVFSSTAAGYLILSNLKDSTYTFNLGFPGTTGSEGQFTVAVSGRDKGFGVKNIDGTLALFDLQNLSLIKSGGRTGGTAVRTIPNPDAFTRTLSQASNDPTLLQVPEAPTSKPVIATTPEPSPGPVTVASEAATRVATAVDTVILQQPAKQPVAEEQPVNTNTSVVIQKPEPQPDSVQTASPAVTTVPARSDSTAIQPPVVQATPVDITATQSTQTVSQPVSAPDTTTQNTMPAPPAFERSRIVQRSESSTTQGFGLVYLDYTSQGVDTIRLLIPNTRYVSLETPGTTVRNAPPTTEAPLTTPQPEPKKETTERQPVPQPQPETVTSNTGTAKEGRNNCRYEASEADFIKLRRNMTARPSEEAMVKEAGKAFKVRCYSTAYLRKLSSLFLYEEAKYAFLELAYQHVLDPENFASLEAELKETYYINRFKALVAAR